MYYGKGPCRGIVHKCPEPALIQGFLQQDTEFSGEISTEDRVLCLLWNPPNYHQTYEEILDITLILTFSCCRFSTANTGEVIFLHYFDFVSCYKKCK